MVRPLGLWLVVTLLLASGAGCSLLVERARCQSARDCPLGEACIQGACTATVIHDAGGSPLQDAGDVVDAGDTDAGSPVDAGISDGGQDAGTGDADAGPAPSIESFEVAPNPVAYGAPVNVSWQTTGVTVCRLDGTDIDLAPDGALALDRPHNGAVTLRCTDQDRAVRASVDLSVSCTGATYTPPSPELAVTSQEDVVELGASLGCAAFQGSLIVGPSTTNDPITSLVPLYGLTAVTGDLFVVGNQELMSLAGLELLSSVAGDLGLGASELGSVTPDPNEALASLAGLAGLTVVGDRLLLYGPSLFTSLVGLEQLAELGDELRVHNNDSLLHVDDLRSLAFIGDDLRFAENASLERVTLPLPTHLENDLEAIDNPRLETLSLPALTQVVDDVNVIDNDRLPSLGGLGALQRIGGQLRIEDNLVLARLGLPSLETLGIAGTGASEYEVHICENPALPLTEAQETIAQTNRSVAESNVVVDDVCP